MEAVVRAVPEGRAASLGGLESTAPGGEGEGIEPFRPSPRLVEIGISMRVPLDKVRHSPSNANSPGVRRFICSAV